MYEPTVGETVWWGNGEGGLSVKVLEVTDTDARVQLPFGGAERWVPFEEIMALEMFMNYKGL